MADEDAKSRDDLNQSEGDTHRKISLAEEVATIRKRVVDQGGVSLETVTETHDEIVSATLNSSNVEVKRVPRDEVVKVAPPIREEGNITIIPVLEERVVLRTELVLVEEVHLIRSETRETVEVPVSLRSQRVIETRLEADEAVNEEAPNSATNLKEEDNDL
ncbi:DUF2382 domain-containing protein [Paracoccus albus]|uniref:DUF2382 domain-containing protein n=1 Tax=Paracoccus albus TaxID=3017784 RepID=UPI0022F14451|nr:DUF2382 domain-containing protein [Paracoccus albus]WBU60015.1 DUF2382 domain-containing protein [Paracoccus albus]